MINKQIFTTVFLLLVVFIPLSLKADSSTFTIGVLAGEDNEAPTTPTLLSATPVAYSQIDLAWSSSTDNVVIYGYVLSRDSVPIATTTNTSFNDTGLSASTTYSYSVQAFDGFYNYSSSSNILATTTLAIPIVPVATSTNSQATLVFRLQNFSLTTGEQSAKIVWETSKPARYQLRWGRTLSYEIGYVVSNVYLEKQLTTITDLEPGTKYMYELYSYDGNGRELLVERSSFVTKSLSLGAVPNVQNLKVTTLSDKTVDLRYQIPASEQGASVRIVRSYFGYPRDPQDGAILYEGTLENFLDTKAFKNSGIEYYAVFLRRPDGTFSSGSVGVARLNPTPVTGGQNEHGEVVEEVLPDIPWAEFAFDVSKIQLIQESKIQTFKDEQIVLSRAKQILVRIEAGATPDTLKSIIVTFKDEKRPDFKSSFLLRINKDKTAYEAVVEGIDISGYGQVSLEIFDFDRNLVGRYQKTVLFEKTEVNHEVVFPDQIVKKLTIVWSLLAIIFGASAFTWLLFFYRRRRAEDKD